MKLFNQHAYIFISSFAMFAMTNSANAQIGNVTKPVLQYVTVKSFSSGTYSFEKNAGKFEQLGSTPIEIRAGSIANGKLRAFTSDGEQWFSIINKTNGENCFYQYTSYDNFIAQKAMTGSCRAGQSDTFRGLAYDGNIFYSVNYISSAVGAAGTGPAHAWRTYSSWQNVIDNKPNTNMLTNLHAYEIYRSLGFDPVQRVFTTVAQDGNNVWFQKYTSFSDVVANQPIPSESFYTTANGAQFLGSAIGPVDKTLDVFIVAGQSNAVGYTGYVSGLAASSIDENIKFHYRIGHATPTSSDVKSSNVTTLRPTLAPTNPNYSIFGIEMGSLRSLYQDGRANLAVVKVGYGSTSLYRDWKITEPSLKNITRVLQNELSFATSVWNAQGYRTRIAGIFWMQGEEDGKTQDAAYAYKSNLEQFVKTVRSWSGNSCIPFVLGKIKTNGSWPYGEVVRAAQESVKDYIPCSDVVQTDTLGMDSDTYHYNPAGLLYIGNEMAAKYLKISGQ